MIRERRFKAESFFLGSRDLIKDLDTPLHLNTQMVPLFLKLMGLGKEVVSGEFGELVPVSLSQE